MSNFNTLKTISEKYKGKEVQNIAADLGICIKTQEDSQKDFHSSNPLNNTNAVLTLAGNQYVIYCKSGTYKDFYILHEICHYLLKHNCDGEFEESSANILACMILIPQKELTQDMLTLSYRYNIPTDVVYKYIPLIRNNIITKQTRFFKISVFITALISLIVIIFALYAAFNNKADLSTAPLPLETTEYTSEQLTASDSTEATTSTPNLEQVYVTMSGKKYHKSDCFYIADRTTMSLTVTEAEQQGYSPCSVCFN